MPDGRAEKATARDEGQIKKQQYRTDMGTVAAVPGGAPDWKRPRHTVRWGAGGAPTMEGAGMAGGTGSTGLMMSSAGSKSETTSKCAWQQGVLAKLGSSLSRSSVFNGSPQGFVPSAISSQQQQQEARFLWPVMEQS